MLKQKQTTTLTTNMEDVIEKQVAATVSSQTITQ